MSTETAIHTSDGIYIAAAYLAETDKQLVDYVCNQGRNTKNDPTQEFGEDCSGINFHSVNVLTKPCALQQGAFLMP